MEKNNKLLSKPAHIAAIELMARDVSLTNKQVASAVGITPRTLSLWLANPDFIESLYKRYMEVSGIHLPEVVQAMIEEAKLGNVHAARLILEHYGKLENKIKVQVESNFEKFMKTDNAEEADFFEISQDDERMFDDIAKDLGSDNIEVQKRHPSNNAPKVRDEYERYRVKKTIKKAVIDKETQKKQADRYLIRKRAQAVNLDLLPPGRHTKSERNAWMKQLEKLEAEKNQ